MVPERNEIVNPARLVVLLAVVTLSIAYSGCRPAVQGNGQNVLLVTFETTRADHLSAYGYDRQTTPGLEQIASEGFLFERCSSVSPRTNPSLATLLTGRFPHEHGVRNLLLPLEPEEKTLAELFRDAGYYTAGVQTHPRLIAASGFGQGFDEYFDDYKTYPLADQASAKALEWIRKKSNSKRPWFMWLHLMDPHWTYDPPGEVWGTFGAKDPRPKQIYQELANRTRTIGPIVFNNAMPEDEVQAFVDAYDEEILYTDQAFEELFSALRAEGILDSTLTVITADHGESLGENGYFFEHGDLGSEPEIHIPLIFHGPELPATGSQAATVSNIDIAPTILEMVGIPSQGAFRGQSLLNLFTSEAEDRIVFGEIGKKFHEENPFRTLEGPKGKWRWAKEGQFKLVYRPGIEGTVVELYDLVSPAGEQQDVSEQHPDIKNRLFTALKAWMSEDDGKERTYHISEEAEEILRSLGYIN